MVSAWWHVPTERNSDSQVMYDIYSVKYTIFGWKGSFLKHIFLNRVGWRSAQIVFEDWKRVKERPDCLGFYSNSATL